MDHWIAGRCSGHAVMMVCCATEKDDSDKTRLKTAELRIVRSRDTQSGYQYCSLVRDGKKVGGVRVAELVVWASHR